MPKVRRLLREDISYSTARREEVNMLHRLKYYDQQNEFFSRVADNRGWIKAVVAHHLGLGSPDECQVADIPHWFHGSFNVCIPVTINNKDWKNTKRTGQRVLLRLPLPYRVGESYNPGNADEKIRCEAGTYAWLQDNCPDVPIPKLYGFALATGETFTHFESLPFWGRCVQSVYHWFLSCLRRPVPTRYVSHSVTHLLGCRTLHTGYILVEYIEPTAGKMLSSTWLQDHGNAQLRANLFRDLSRILLSVTRLPLPRIGSFMIDNDGFLQLTNRPLSLEIQDLENERIPTNMARDYTYCTVNSYVMDILGVHNSRLINQPNAVNDTGDYLYQASALTAMQATIPSFFQRKFDRGPFVLSLTDLHPSNIFVDENWHITALIDLEWACVRPIELFKVPIFTAQAVDEIAAAPDNYEKVQAEFIEHLIVEEEKRSGPTDLNSNDGETRLSTIIKKRWESGTFWYSLALASPTGLFSIFYKQIQPRFLKHCSEQDNFHQVMPWYWSQDFVRIGANKLSDKKEYDIQLEQEFQVDS